MNEQECTQRAYGETVETVFKVFFGEFTSAHGDPEAEQGAKERFRKASSTPNTCATWRSLWCHDSLPKS